MSHRDELADIIETRIRLTGNPQDAADSILAAGYRRPGSVTRVDIMGRDCPRCDETIDSASKGECAGFEVFELGPCGHLLTVAQVVHFWPEMGEGGADE